MNKIRRKNEFDVRIQEREKKERVNNSRQIFYFRFAKTVAVLFCAGFLFLGFTKTTLATTTTNYCNDASAAGCWYMNGETSGTEIDKSDNGNDLTFGGTTSSQSLTVPTSPAYVGYSRLFSSGYLTKNVEGGVLDINGATAKVSITAWVKVTSVPDSGMQARIVSKNDAASNNERQYSLYIIGNGSSNFQFKAAVSSAGTASTVILSTASTFALDTWYHVTFVDNNTDLRIYVNGALASTPVAYTSGIFNGNSVFLIGAEDFEGGTFGNYFSGNIDEVAVFNRGLSSTEVSEIYNSGLTGNNGGYDIYTIFYNTNGTIPSPIYSETNTALDALCVANPTWSCVTYGQSAQGRNIRGIIIAPTGYTKTIMLDAGMHGNELIMTKAVLDFLSYLSANPTMYPNIRWITAPMLNPDGDVLSQQNNNNTTAVDLPTPRQVNLNRNFPTGWGVSNGFNAFSTDPSNADYIGPYAESEPETLVMESIINTYHPNQHFNGHGFDDALYVDPGLPTTNVSAINSYLASNNFEQFPPSVAHGGVGVFRSWVFAQGMESYTYEIGTRSNVEEINRYIGAVKALADSTPIYANGRLGTNNGASFDTLTSGNAYNCYAGTVTNFTGTGPWTWYCAGVGGAPDSGTGTANINQYAVTPSAGTGDTIFPATILPVTGADSNTQLPYLFLLTSIIIVFSTVYVVKHAKK